MNDLNRHTLVLGASDNPERYSYLAIRQLRAAGIPVSALGGRPGMVEDVSILTQWDQLPEIYIDTITLYMGEKRQHEHYAYILSRHPRRLIFNPGAENDELVGWLRRPVSKRWRLVRW